MVSPDIHQQGPSTALQDAAFDEGGVSVLGRLGVTGRQLPSGEAPEESGRGAERLRGPKPSVCTKHPAPLPVPQLLPETQWLTWNGDAIVKEH